MFGTYLEIGYDHILDIQGYDHVLFILALCAVYELKEWKKVLILVTAFTIGHSITLALSALDILTIPAHIIETLIPITIILTGLINIVTAQQKEQKTYYLLPLFFGFIHGMGFSNFFKALLGKSEDIVLPLFAFNVGVELAQIIVVVIALLLSFIFISGLNMQKKIWVYILSGIAIVVSILLLVGVL